MNAGRLQNVRNWVLMLALAVMLAVGAVAAPAVIDGVAGTHMSSAVHACDGNNGGC